MFSFLGNTELFVNKGTWCYKKIIHTKIYIYIYEMHSYIERIIKQVVLNVNTWQIWIEYESASFYSSNLFIFEILPIGNVTKNKEKQLKAEKIQ